MRAKATSSQVGFLTMLVATPLRTMAAHALFLSRHRLTRVIFLLLITPMNLIAVGTF